MKVLLLSSMFVLVGTTALAVDENPAVEDSIKVTVVGSLRTGIAAIGGETTGSTITAKGITWELDFGKQAAIRQAAEQLSGKKVIVRGSLERRQGVEIQQRWIVTVTSLQAAGKAAADKVYKSPNGKAFPQHWGAPPRLQTRDLRPLPGGYGKGSGTLATWIQENLDRDAQKKDDR
jgi:hypothetical protein